MSVEAKDEIPRNRSFESETLSQALRCKGNSVDRSSVQLRVCSCNSLKFCEVELETLSNAE